MAEKTTPAGSSSSVSAAQPYNAGQAPRKRSDGRGYILAVAGLQAVGGVMSFAMNSKTEGANPLAGLIIMLSLSAIFLGLWLWAKTAPFPALLTTLIVFVTFHLVDAVIDPLTLVRGLLIKIIILAGLATALKKAYIAKREHELEATGN